MLFSMKIQLSAVVLFLGPSIKSTEISSWQLSLQACFQGQYFWPPRIHVEPVLSRNFLYHRPRLPLPISPGCQLLILLQQSGSLTNSSSVSALFRLLLQHICDSFRRKIQSAGLVCMTIRMSCKANLYSMIKPKLALVPHNYFYAHISLMDCGHAGRMKDILSAHRTSQ